MLEYVVDYEYLFNDRWKFCVVKLSIVEKQCHHFNKLLLRLNIR